MRAVRPAVINCRNLPLTPSHGGVLGSSGPGAGSQEPDGQLSPSGVQKANLLFRCRNARSDSCCTSVVRQNHAARLQGPMSTLSPAMGVTCGRREREAGTEHWRSNPLHGSALAAVEGILVHATSSTFAGRRNNVSLGRSEASVAGLVPLQAVAPMTAGVLWKKEEGNVVSMREAHALDASMPKKHRHVQRTRPSLGPETRARRSACSVTRRASNA